jgi:hypothetical protein
VRLPLVVVRRVPGRAPPRAVLARLAGAFVCVVSAITGGATLSRCNRDISRDLRRAAAFR